MRTLRERDADITPQIKAPSVGTLNREATFRGLQAGETGATGLKGRS